MTTPNEKNKGSPADRGNGRIGKALLKYFKPIRSALPHLYTWQNNKPKATEEASEPQLDLNQATRQAVTTDSLKESSLAVDLTPSPMLSPAKPEIPLTPAVTLAEMPKHWLDLILTLLSACKRVSVKMGSQLGMQTYRTMLANRGRSNIQSKGSIIDTTPIAVSDEEDDEDHKRTA